MSQSPDFISIPTELSRSFHEWDHSLKQLRADYPWLQDLDKKLPGLDLSNLRQAFLTDGHTFMSVVDQFLSLRKWQDFVLQTCIGDHKHGPVLIGLLNSVRGPFKDGPVEGFGDISAEETLRNLQSVLPDSDRIRARHQNFLNAIKTEIHQEHDDDTSYRRSCSKRKLIPELAETLKLELRDVKDRLSTILHWIEEVNVTDAELMTFGYPIIGFDQDPHRLPRYRLLRRIGKVLCALGLRLGANVPRWPTEYKPVTLIKALKDVVNGQAPAVNIMLARLEQQQVSLHSQRQVITALQFRHLLEHLPRSLYPKVAIPAERWYQMREVERWEEFWKAAVRQVYKVYDGQKNDTTDTRSKTTAKEYEPSPFAELLGPYLPEAAEKKDEDTAVTWLATETEVGKDMKTLYSTLSKVIHQFSGGEFTVNSWNFSPNEAQLLTALVPKKLGDGKEMDWHGELRRYVWSPVGKLAKASPTVKEKSIVKDGSTVKEEPSDKDANDRVSRLWTSFRSNSPFPEISFDQLATLNSDNVTALYVPAAKHINSNGLLHGGVLATMVEGVGRMALAASGPSGRYVRTDRSDRIELKFSYLSKLSPGARVQVSGTLSKVGKKADLNWCTNVEFKQLDKPGAVVARGSFRAWEVQDGEEAVGIEGSGA